MHSYFQKSDVFLGLGAFIGLILCIKEIATGSILLTVSLVLLSCFYFVQGFLSLTQSKNIPYLIILHSIWGTVILGLFFKTMLWIKMHWLLQIGLMGQVILMIILLFQLRLSFGQKSFETFRQLLIKNLCILAVSFMLFITPYSKLATLYFKNQPEYLERVIQHLNTPHKISFPHH